MCDPVTIGILGLVSSVGGSFLSNRAQQQSVKQYNQQAQHQNEMLQKQFQDKQAKIQLAREGQAKVFEDITNQQSAEVENQKSIRDERQKQFQESLAKGDDLTTNNAAAVASTNQADQLYADTGHQLPASYQTPTTGSPSTENRVIDSINSETAGQKSKIAEAIAKALASTTALNASGTARAGGIADLATTQNDYANKANASENLLNAGLRPLDYKMKAFSNVMGEEASDPYYRGVEPSYAAPRDPFGSILQGAGSLGTTYAFMQPKAAARKAPVGAP